MLYILSFLKKNYFVVMNHQFHYIHLSQLDRLTQGRPNQRLSYLHQFLELLPKKIEVLAIRLQQKKRFEIKKIIHNISPQLIFFGVPNIQDLAKKIVMEYEFIAIEQLELIVNEIIFKTKKALEEVKFLLDNLSS